MTTFAVPLIALVASPLMPVAPPDTRCVCGGLLIYVAGRVTHTDVCADCLDGGCRVECAERHVVCATPEAAQCAHPGCHADTAPTSITMSCAADHDECCGCCWEPIYGS